MARPTREMVKKRLAVDKFAKMVKRQRDPTMALQMLSSVPDGFRHDRSTYDTLIHRLGRAKMFAQMEFAMEKLRNERHLKFREGLLSDVIKSYGQARMTDAAIRTFQRMPHFGCKPSAFQLMEEMTQEGLYPNVVIYTSLISGLCNVQRVEEALKLKEEMLAKGLILDTATYSALINGLCKAGRESEVNQLLEEMAAKGCRPDTVTYNTLITSLCNRGMLEDACNLLDRMTGKHCKPDVLSYNIVMIGLCREAKVQEAIDLFEDMPRRGCSPDVVTFRILVDGLCRAGKFSDAAMILDEMVFKGFAPRSCSAGKLICGLCNEGKVDLASKALMNVVKMCAVELLVWHVLIPCVCKETQLRNASECFNDILKMP